MTLSRHQIVVAACVFVLVLSVLVAMPARAAVTFRAATSANNGAGTATVVIDKPTGTQEGDLMLAFIGVRTTPGITTPSGWTLVGNTSNSGVMQQFVYYRFATSADASTSNYTWSLGSSNKAAGGIISYSGVNTSNPINVWQGAVNASSTSVSSPNVSTTVANAMIVNSYSAATVATYTGNKTERYEVSSSGGGQAGTKISVMSQDHVQASTGSSASPGSATLSVAADTIGQTVALAPSPPATLTQSAYRWFTNVDAANFSNVTTNPTTGTDAIYAATNDSSYMYTTGYVSSNGNDWRIEKRNLSDGALVSGFGTSGVIDINVSANDDRAWGIDQDASYIYVVGQDATVSSTNTQWRIEKRDKTTGALVSGFGSGGVVQLNQTSGFDVPKEVKVDGSYVYVAGFDNTGAGAWRIEKRDITTGALVSGFGSSGAVVTDYEATENDEIAAMVIDADNIYVGGFDYASGVTNSQIRIEKRDKATGALVSGFGSGGAVVENPFTGNSNSSVDDGVVYKGLVLSGGNLYIAASQGVTGNTDFQWRIAKRDAMTGALVTGFGTSGVVNVDPSTAVDNPTTIRTDGTSLFVAGFDRTLDSSTSQWRIEKRDMTSGALVSGFGTNGVVTSNPSTNHDELRDVVVSGGSIFPVGYDYSPGNIQMRIEKRNTVNGNGPSDDGTPRAALNTAVTSVATNEQVRLRFLLRAGTSALGTSEQQFKLQFAEQSGVCDTDFSGEAYADVTTSTAIAYHDNVALSDASTAYLNVNDPTDGANPVRLQTYEEASNFTNTASAIPIDSNGLWDVALYNRSAPDGKAYCFRVVDSAGSVLSTYAQIPELSTPALPAYTQAGYRWYANTDSTSPGSPLAAQDVPASISSTTPFRMRQRIAVDNASLSQSGQNFKLQYAEKVGVCDTGFTGEIYSDMYPIASTSSTKSAGAAANDSSVGDTAWSTPTNATADDAVETDATKAPIGTSNYLVSSSHGFSVPSNATINGIELIIDRRYDGFDATESNIRLVKGGTIQSTNKMRSMTSWDNVYGNWGGATDLWGSAWTPADINAADFGAAVSVSLDGDGASISAFVDHIAIKVYYTVPDASGALKYYDNVTPSDDSTITSTANDPTNGARPTVLQNYRETDPFTNVSAAISNGSDGLWDFALTSTAAADGKSYCLRVVKSDGSVLDTYSQIAEVTIASGGGPVTPTLNQQLRGGQSVIDGIKRAFMW